MPTGRELSDKQRQSDDCAELLQSQPGVPSSTNITNAALRQAVMDLRSKESELGEARQQRQQLAAVFMIIVLYLTLYSFVIGLFYSGFWPAGVSAVASKWWVSRCLELLALLLVIYMIFWAGLTLEGLGLTLKNWQRSVLEALGVSAAAVIALVLIKVAVNRVAPGIFSELDVVNLHYFAPSYVTYAAIAPLHEFIARGAVQSTLERLFEGQYKRLMAIVATSCLFGTLHVFTSFSLGVVALVSSLVWGWMFSRHKSLVGVSLSHFLVGDLSGLMGYWTFFL